MDDRASCLKLSMHKFLNFVDEIEKNKLSDLAIRRGYKNYDIKNLKVNNITPIRARKIYESLVNKHQNTEEIENSWLENQRRLFVYVLICYAHQNKKQIQNFSQEDFKIFYELFPLKAPQLIKFQSYSILKKDAQCGKWTEQEDKILTNLIKAKEENNEIIEWSRISKDFFKRTNQQKFRNAKQCRQRWQNHLDPNKMKGKWEISQDIILFTEVLENGKKWSKIALNLNGKKSEHMVKNRFKSIIHKMQKKQQNQHLKQEELIHKILKQLKSQENKKNMNLLLTNEGDSSIQDLSSRKQSIRNNDEILANNHNNSPIVSEQIEKQSAEKNRKRNNFIEDKNQTKDKHKHSYPIIIKPIKHNFSQENANNRVQIANKSKDLELQSKKKVQKTKVLMKSQLKSIQDNQSDCKQEEEIRAQLNLQMNYNQIANTNPPTPTPMHTMNAHSNSFGGYNMSNNSSKNDNQLFDRLFQSSGTPIPDTSRFSSIILDARSPGNNFLVSPFPPRWTPTILFVEDAQGQVSPQVGFGNFCSKFNNDFHKFIAPDNSRKNE